MKKLTTYQFINKARNVHGNKYNYSKTVYKNYYNRVIITCPEHGDFWQQPRCHLMKRGCPKCGVIQSNIDRTLTTKEFIERSVKVHGNKYGYRKVVYKNLSTEVKIICPEHGEFKQRANAHLVGSGCSECGKISTSDRLKLTTEQFINKAQKIHGNRYSYLKALYRHSYKNISIICMEHGEFNQKPYHHIEGAGCPVCVKEKLARYNKDKTLTTEEFIERSRKKHGNRYNYSRAVYLNGYTKTLIICPRHGEFYQRASTHMEGQGCPTCKKSKEEMKIEEWLIKNEILHVSQKTFPECRGKRYPLRFDFYLPEFNTCIEFDGEQHYYKYPYFVKDLKLIELKFTENKLYDKIKDNYCLKNDIKLIRIRRRNSIDKALSIIKK